ncbi:MAG: DUF499 domain-containing protein [Acetobacteraceae bacterium]
MSGPMEPWYKVAVARQEVREGRSFNPDEFAIALEQVVAGTAPEDYRNPEQFFARTSFTRALRSHTGMVLRRLAGRTANTAPVLTLITQFGGGKTHTLTTLYHLAGQGEAASVLPGVSELLAEAGLGFVPRAKVAVFVGNAWDPHEGRETPWIDLARQLAGEAGVAALGPACRTSPPGTEAIGAVFRAANAPVLLLFDEVLNFLNRHRAEADSFHAFIQNLTVAMTATTQSAAMISLPRSQVEMTERDQEWQDRISKVVRRVAKDLIANDEAEIAEVVRRRLFEDLGAEKTRKNIAKNFAEWCFARRAQLPPEWTDVDSAATEAKGRDNLERRFAACYPFHPATLSVFQRKWQALPQYQQTRGTLAMLAQWISLAAQESFRKARNEPLITLGSAPLAEPGFRSVMLGQLGEPRLLAAIETDIAGERAHARALDADKRGPLCDIHRRAGAAILFESSGGQADKAAHLPELRFALGEPGLDTTTIDNAASALEDRSYFIRRVGTDGFRIGYRPTMRKVVSDRRASLDEDSEVGPAMLRHVETEFRRGAALPVELFAGDAAELPDQPRLSLVVAGPALEWQAGEALRAEIGEWTRNRGSAPRRYPAALVWCLKKPGRELRDRVELALAWRKVAREVDGGMLGSEFERNERAELATKVKEAEEAARDAVWSDYRFVLLSDRTEPAGLKLIDLGAGHASSGGTLTARVVAALKSEALLNESIGAGYLERRWPPALVESGAWPLASLRQSFLDGSLTRLIDPDAVLKPKIAEFVMRGDFGVAWGDRNGGFAEARFQELLAPDDVEFSAEMFLLRKERALAFKAGVDPAAVPEAAIIAPLPPDRFPPPRAPARAAVTGRGPRRLSLEATVPHELWNRLGTRILPKLRAGSDLRIGVSLALRVPADSAEALADDLRVVLDELGLPGAVTLE